MNDYKSGFVCSSLRDRQQTRSTAHCPITSAVYQCVFLLAERLEKKYIHADPADGFLLLLGWGSQKKKKILFGKRSIIHAGKSGGRSDRKSVSRSPAKDLLTGRLIERF